MREECPRATLEVEEVNAMSVAVHPIGSGTARGPSRRTFGRSVRRIGLGIFFVSVALNAALGIYAVLMPDFGDTAQRILVSSLCVTGALLMALCCEPAWERRLLAQVPAAGALLGAAAFAGLIIGIWTEPESQVLRNVLWSTFAIAIACTGGSLLVLERARKGISVAHERVLTATLGLIALAAAVAVVTIWVEPAEDTLGKIGGSAYVVAAACLLAALLTLARLARRHRWVQGVTLALLVLGAGIVVLGIWVEEGLPLGRAMGVALIAFAAFAVTVPVLHWVDRGVVAVARATGDAVRFCPHCGAKLSGEPRIELACSRCGREFTVTPVRFNLT
jgi:hypothetical protein